MILKYWNPQGNAWSYEGGVSSITKRRNAQARWMSGPEKPTGIIIIQQEDKCLDFEGGEVAYPTADMIFHGTTLDLLRDNPGKQVTVMHVHVRTAEQTYGLAFERGIEVYLLSDSGETIERL